MCVYARTSIPHGASTCQKTAYGKWFFSALWALVIEVRCQAGCRSLCLFTRPSYQVAKFVDSARDTAHDIVHARQVLYHWFTHLQPWSSFSVCFFLLIFICLGILPVCMSVCHVLAVSGGIRSPGTGVRQLWPAVWVGNWTPVLLATEPPLQPLK